MSHTFLSRSFFDKFDKATIRTSLTLRTYQLPPQLWSASATGLHEQKHVWQAKPYHYLISSLNLCHSLSFLEEQLHVIPTKEFVLVIQPLLLPDVHKEINHLLQFHGPGLSNTSCIKMVSWNVLDLTWRGMGWGNGLFDPSRLSYAAFQLHNKYIVREHNCIILHNTPR
jgi:hypothetical protein